MRIWITEKPIQIADALNFVRHPSCGAVATFEGNIRLENDGKKVLGLEYEVYQPLFQNVVLQICQEMKERWALHKIALIQRIGRLDAGETGIVITVSSIHRRDSLEALSYAIEEFKKRAPVWKKEFYREGAAWISCHISPA
jgi:molybdopterin synthase catalytic subunit